MRKPFDLLSWVNQSKIEMDKKDRKETKYATFFKAPIRVLTKARHLYVRTLLDWAARGEYHGASGYCTDGLFYNLPGTMNFMSAENSAQNEDVTDLVRAASAWNPSSRVQSEILRQPRCVKLPAAAGRRSLRRMGTVGIIGRIEEDKACEFGEGCNGRNKGMFSMNEARAGSWHKPMNPVLQAPQKM